MQVYPNHYKNNFLANIKKNFLNIRMIRTANLSLDELKLIPQNRNISDYKNKPKKKLVKAISEPKPKIKTNKKKLEELRKDFDKLRHKFSQTEAISIEKFFMILKIIDIFKNQILTIIDIFLIQK